MTESDDNLQSDDFRPDGLVFRALRGPEDTGYRLVIWAFVLASLSHLWLEDVGQSEWMLSNAIYVVGLLVLVVGRGALGWLTCAVALSIPLLFLRDQLTQSLLLLVVSASGCLFVLRRPADVAGFLRVLRGLTIATYCFAVWHKLNRDFFDPAVGCASYGFEELATYYGLDPGIFGRFDHAHAPIVLLVEFAIPLAYLLGRRHFARFLAVGFHIPLTVTMAPAFAFVMAVGHAAFVTDEDRAAFREVWVRWRAPLLVAATIVTSASLAAHGAWPEPMMVPREWLLWFAFLWCGAVMLTARPVRPSWAGTRHTWRPSLVVCLFVANGMTPYFGLQYQHAAAMLSNLRIDEGCWNHLVMPEGLRLREDYVRVETVAFGAPGRIAEYEEIVRTQLWSPPQFRQMRRNWCRPEVRPLSMEGTYRGHSWVIEDLCAEDQTWPFGSDGVLGVELFGNFLRFQKNLGRECPQTCIH